MKALKGGRMNDLTPYQQDGATFAQASFRWVLSDPHVDAVLISMTSIESIDEYVAT